MANDTLDFVPRKSLPPGANVMHSHFVFDIKPRPDGSIEKFKARLVADGNTQKPGVDFEHVFATVVKLASIRVLLALAAAFSWGLWQLDVKQAFLQADLAEDLYMRVPPHLPDRDADGNLLVCKLKKSLYGLRQAAREWAQLLTATLLRFGFRQSSIDTCVYVYNTDAASGSSDPSAPPAGVLILLVYVDDLVLAYSSELLRSRFVSFVTDALPIDDRGELQWILRMEIRRDVSARTLVLSQEHYVLKLLEKYGSELKPDACFETPLDPEHALTAEQCPAPNSPEWQTMSSKRPVYMSIVGALLWLAAGSRPDITYAVSHLARFCSNPGLVHYKMDALILYNIC